MRAKFRKPFPVALLRIFLSLLGIWIVSFNKLEARKLRVLFIGNSYTTANNLPQLLGLVASSQGDTLISDISALCGYTFKNHIENASMRTKIAAGKRDFLVLQAQSQESTFQDESFIWFPDLTGDLVQHGAVVLFSPGTKVNGILL
jgi:hypothetical protein